MWKLTFTKMLLKTEDVAAKKAFISMFQLKQQKKKVRKRNRYY